MNDQESAAALSAAAQDIERLKARVARLEQLALPRTWLLSPSFLKRAFSVLGLGLVAYLIILVPLYAFIIIAMVVPRLFMGW
jgi:hypothetical protein